MASLLAKDVGLKEHVRDGGRTVRRESRKKHESWSTMEAQMSSLYLKGATNESMASK